MLYLEFLQKLHEVAAPTSYLEIGVRTGESLALARSTAVGIDPAYDLLVKMRPDVTLYRGTSDDYFTSDAIGRDLPGGRIDLAFIDGMHLFEFVLRDFMNIEAHSGPHSVVVVDDVLPRNRDETGRDHMTPDWTGDVWKIIPILARYRPDLKVLHVATQPTGLLLVMGLDPESRELPEQYENIVAEFHDVVDVPVDILDRRQAVAPDDLLAARFWSDLRLESGHALPVSAREWTPTRALSADEIEASKLSPWHDEMTQPSDSVLTRIRRRIRRQRRRRQIRRGG